MLSDSEQREIETFARRYTPYNSHAESVAAVLTRWEESRQNCSNTVTGKTTRFDLLHIEMKYVYIGLYNIFQKKEDLEVDYYTLRDLLTRLIRKINEDEITILKAKKEKIDFEYQQQIKEIDCKLSKLGNNSQNIDKLPEPDCT